MKTNEILNNLKETGYITIADPNENIKKLAELDEGDPDIKELEKRVDELEKDKVDKIEGKELSSNDFTDELKEKLETLDETAEGVHIKSDWNAPAGDSAEILNRPSVDDVPTLNSNNLVKSGGVATQISQLGQDVNGLSRVVVSPIGGQITTTNRASVNITSDRKYILTQKSNYGLIYVYFYYNNSQVGDSSYFTTENQIVITNKNIDQIAFYKSGTASEDVVVEIQDTYNISSRISAIEGEVSNISTEQKDFELCEDTYLIARAEYKATPNAYTIPLIQTIKAGTKVKVSIKSADTANGSLYVYLKMNSTDVYSYGGVNIGRETPEITLPGDINGVALYHPSVSTEGNIIVNVKIESALQKEVHALSEEVKTFEDIEGVYLLTNYLYTASENSTTFPLSSTIQAGRKIKVSLKIKDSASGSVALYLKKDSTTIHTFYSIAIGSSIDVILSDDVNALQIYHGSSIGTAGSIDIIVADITENTVEVDDKVDTNILLGPKDFTLIGTNVQYLSEEILSVDVKEGEILYFHFDKIINNIVGGGLESSAPIVIYYYNGSTQVSDEWINRSTYIKVPSGINKLVFKLYPWYSATTSKDVNVTYKYVYITYGNKADYYIRGRFTSVGKPNDYYFIDDYLPNKVARINELLSKYSQGDAFFFVCDTHWSINQRQSPSLIKYIKDNTGIDRIFFGGDYHFKIDKDFIELARNGFDAENAHFVMGNHDYLEMTTSSQLALAYKSAMNNCYGDIQHWYYYFDDNFRKIRYIILAAYDESLATKNNDPSLSQNATDGYSESQYQWIEDAALGTAPEGYDIVVFTHQMGDIDISASHNNEIVGRKTRLEALLNTEKTTNGRHIVCLQGHSHRDRVFYTDEDIPVIMTTADKNVAWPSEEERSNPSSPYYNWYPDLDVDRTSKTIREQAFDICFLNTNEHNIRLVRIGGKARDGVGNNAGDEVEERFFEY